MNAADGPQTPRPDRLVVVTGTGTEVGKTWITAELCRRLRAGGTAVAARKPAQSFEPGDTSTDAAVLGDATGVPAETVCASHRWYPLALAPPMAADALGLAPIALDDLVAELEWPPGAEVGFLEGAGGLRSPIAHDGDTLSLVERLNPDLVLVVAATLLGVVSHVRLVVQAVAGFDVLVVLNRFDPGDEVHRRSRDWLANNDSLPVVTDRDITGGDLDMLLDALGSRPKPL